MRTHSIPATSLVCAAVFTNKKVEANVEPSIGVHVEVLHGTDNGTAFGLGRAGLGDGVVNYDGGHRPRQYDGIARRGS